VRFVVIGAGAIGGTVAARLHEAGREVVAIARGAHLAAIREHGLRVEEPDRSRTVRLATAADVGEIDWRPDDVALMCTKTQDSEAILDALRAVAPDVTVACLQNGVANERLAAARFANVQAVYVVLPAEHLEPGLVVGYSGPVPGILDVGRYPREVDEITERISDGLGAAGYSSSALVEVMPWKYRKLLVNLANAAEAACGPDDPGLRDLVRAARAEGERSLDAAGIGYASGADDRRRADGFVTFRPAGEHARAGGSTWQSLRRGTGSVEAQFLNGEIVSVGREHGVPTPVNEVLLSTITAMARDREQPGARSAAELLAAAVGRAD
jgi:2-dehydropantoate 2-reductase